MTKFRWFQLWWLVLLTLANTYQAIYFISIDNYLIGAWNVFGMFVCLKLWESYKNILWRWGES